MDIDHINKFLKRLHSSQKAGSRDFRLTMEEANLLATNISIIISENKELMRKILILEKNNKINNNDNNENIIVKGDRW